MSSTVRSALTLAALPLLSLPAAAAAPPFSTPAPVAYMVDVTSGAVLFAKDADRRMPPASMAKMMTVLVAFDQIKAGKLKLDEMVTVRPETWQQWHGPSAGSTMFLSPGQQVSVQNLLHGIVTLSGNDACVVLAEKIAGTEEAFAALMNQKAKAIGVKSSNFGNSNGWPDEGRSYVTAHDLATVAKATIDEHPKLYDDFYGQPSFTWGQTMGGAPITQANRNPILGKVAGADGLKTGHTEEAGYGFTGSAEQSGRRLVMVVAGLDSFNSRVSESVRFMDWGFNAWEAQPLARAGAVVGTAAVQGGGEDTVPLVAHGALGVTRPKGTNGPVRTVIRYQGPIRAPIAKDAHIADLVVTTSDLPPQVTPLYAGEAVAGAGFFRRAWLGLTGLFG